MKTTFVHICVIIVLACAASGCGNSRNVERELVITDEMLEKLGMSPENDPLLKEMQKENRPTRNGTTKNQLPKN